MEFQLSYFKSWKMMLWKCCTQYASKFGKLSSGHRIGKGQFFIPIPKKGNAKECSNYHTTVLISHASKVIQTQNPPSQVSAWTVNFQMFKLVWEKAEESEIKLPTSAGSWKKQESSRKHLFMFYWWCQSLWLCGSQKMWKILQEMGIPDHLICLLRNLYAGQEATVRSGHGTTDWFQIGKGVCQGCILSPWLFNLYAEYIRKNTGLEEAQAVIKIAGCLGLVHWDDPAGGMGREVGRGFRMGNTCTPMAGSCQCMAKPLQYCKVISLQLKWINL